LKRFSQTDLYHWITESGANHLPILRELPFIYEREAHIVHGVMDILFQRSDGSWVLADYKTSRLRPYPKGGGQTVVNHALSQHATRYHLQVGIYAEAAQQQLAIVPEVYIHYITYDQSIRITPDEWQTALAQGLSARIIDSL
jgi:ATP-dependent exoDNAse (exonuclease V) beta subunit